MKHLALLLACTPLVSSATPVEASEHAPTRPEEQNIVEVAASAGSFETLLAAATAAGLTDTLASDGPFTVFAPTDEAFAKLPKDAVAALLRPENKAKLVEVLTFHVVAGRVNASDAVAAMEAKTLSGDPIRFAIQEGRLRVNGANVVSNDIQTSNGVIHVIDSVLAPPSGLAPTPAGRLVIGVYTDRPSAALCAQLGLERNESLLITSVSKGTAREAGLQKYDVLLSIDGEPASDAQLKRAKQRVGFGGTFDLVLLRKGEKLTQHVKVGIDPH